jgi:shikimate dehydrogenase
MKLALIGKSVQHSRSPELYYKLIGPHVEYDLLDFEKSEDIPSLRELAKKYDGINITSPYKEHFLKDVIITDERVKQLNAINTICFVEDKAFATNTDLLAVVEILKNYQEKYPELEIILMGSGVMARLTTIVANDLNIRVKEYSRVNGDDMSFLDLEKDFQFPTLIINSCSRQFIFKGILHPDSFFWDYNYNFPPHEDHIPQLIRSYQNGQEMLRIQAEAAVKFWFTTNPKLKY